MRITSMAILAGLAPWASAAAAAPDPVAGANAAARVGPREGGFVNAVVLYPWSEGALYQVYGAPGRVTDIALQAGEQLVGSGPVAAGDTLRWIIGQTESGAGAQKRSHVLVKPTAADLATNLVINTDRRTYHLELRATASAYMASVSWRYPQDELIAIRAGAPAAPERAPEAADIDLARLNFAYRIEGKAAWRPLRAYDDGRRVFVDFPASVAQGELPPLFVLSEGGDRAELVNYRVSGRRIVVDRLFGAAELRLGAGRRQHRVRIVREGSR
jgi:type IV secretion system protein VirB9